MCGCLEGFGAACVFLWVSSSCSEAEHGLRVWWLQLPFPVTCFARLSTGGAHVFVRVCVSGVFLSAQATGSLCEVAGTVTLRLAKGGLLGAGACRRAWRVFGACSVPLGGPFGKLGADAAKLVGGVTDAAYFQKMWRPDNCSTAAL